MVTYVPIIEVPTIIERGLYSLLCATDREDNVALSIRWNPFGELMGE